MTSLTWRTFIPGKSEKSHVSFVSLGTRQTRLSGDSWTMKDHIINYHQVAIRSLFLYSDICLLIKSCWYNIKLISITTLISELPQHCVILVQVVNMKSKIHNKTNDKKTTPTWFPRISLVPGWAPQAWKSRVSHLSPGSYRSDGSIVTCIKQTFHLFQMIKK